MPGRASSRVRVLHVNDYRSAGGCEVVMHATVRLLRQRGYEAVVFTSEDVPGLRRTPLGYIDSGASRRALDRVLRDFRPDVVHLHNYYHLLSPGILEPLRRYRSQTALRVIMTAHDYHLVCPSPGLTILARQRLHSADDRRLGSLAYLLSRRWDHRGFAWSALKVAQHVYNYRLRGRRRLIDCVLCPSRFLQRVFARYALPVEHVPYPAPPPCRDAARDADGLRLVFAGRIEPEKGLAGFLESWPRDFAGRLTVVGDGSELGACREACRRLGLEERVEFAGRRDREETLSIIERSHVLVLPSVWVENHPVSLLEALAAGTNILVSDLGGMREIVDDAGVGFVFDPADPATLARALAQVTTAHGEGTLNRFDVSAFLAERDEQAYIERVIGAYSGGR